MKATKPPFSEARFVALRAAVLAARTAREENDLALAIKYGPGHNFSWYSAAERKRCERLSAAYSRASTRMFKLLEKSPRNWQHGVPAHWVACELTYGDAIKLQTTPLEVTPPLSYGATQVKR